MLAPKTNDKAWARDILAEFRGSLDLSYRGEQSNRRGFFYHGGNTFLGAVFPFGTDKPADAAMIQLLLDAGVPHHVRALRENKTPLMEAASQGNGDRHVDAVRVLLRAGADPSVPLHVRGPTAYELAREWGGQSRQLAQLLKDAIVKGTGGS